MLNISLDTHQIINATNEWDHLTKAICDKANALRIDPKTTTFDELFDVFEPYFEEIDSSILKNCPTPFVVDTAKAIVQNAIDESFKLDLPLAGPGKPLVDSPGNEYKNTPARIYTPSQFLDKKEITLSQYYTENNRIGSVIIREFTYGGFTLHIRWNDTGDEQMIMEGGLESVIQRSNEMLNLKNCAMVTAPEFSSDGKNLFIDGTKVLKGWKVGSGEYWLATYQEETQVLLSEDNNEGTIPEITYFGLLYHGSPDQNKDEWTFWSQSDIDELKETGDIMEIDQKDLVSLESIRSNVDPRERFLSEFELVKRDGKPVK